MNLLDTTVVIDYLRGQAAAVSSLEAAAVNEPLGASELIRFEVLAGARADEIGRIERFFSSLLWFPVEESVSRAAARLAARYRSSHSGIDDADYLIAATALVLDAGLLTTNVRHFPMLPGLMPAY